MHATLRARLVDTDNSNVDGLRGKTGELYCRVGLRCIFDGVMTSIVEGIVWFGPHLEVRTKHSKYIFELQE
jgi:hypothetical protein